jgi:hypothetical protein
VIQHASTIQLLSMARRMLSTSYSWTRCVEWFPSMIFELS